MKKKILCLFILFCGIFLFAEQNKENDFLKINENCYFYRLENGLSLFVAENNSVPLAYVEIAVRAGAITQNKDNAGLFHLYEHMMFKGNKKFSDSAKVQKALSDMGTASWNGTTGIECVNYFFTIPKQKLEDGLDFWSNAIRNPLLDSAELEVEKKVVIAEIQGQESNHGRYAGSFINNHLFDKPWQLDPSGSVKNIEKATVQQLKQIQSSFYIPQNAALFVGGDVRYEEVFELVQKIYGDWSNNNAGLAQIESTVEKQSEAPFEKPFLCVMPYDKISPVMAQITAYYRGHDSDFDRKGTYPADLLYYFLEDPKSDFAKEFTQDEKLGIPSSDYVGTGYSTRRRTGVTSVSAVVMSPEIELAERSVYFCQKFDSFMKNYLDNDNIIPEKNRKQIIQRLKDDKVFESETFMGMLNSLRSSWVTTSIDYYMDYISNIQNVTNKDIQDYIARYIAGKNPLVIVYVNPAVYENSKHEFESYGFIEIDSKNAFWWAR